MRRVGDFVELGEGASLDEWLNGYIACCFMEGWDEGEPESVQLYLEWLHERPLEALNSAELRDVVASLSAFIPSLLFAVDRCTKQADELAAKPPKRGRGRPALVKGLVKEGFRYSGALAAALHIGGVEVEGPKKPKGRPQLQHSDLITQDVMRALIASFKTEIAVARAFANARHELRGRQPYRSLRALEGDAQILLRRSRGSWQKRRS